MDLDVPLTNEGREILKDRIRTRVKTIKSAAVSLAILRAQLRWLDDYVGKESTEAHARTDEILDGVSTILDQGE